MESLDEIWRRLLFLFRQRQFESDLDEEMRFHLDMKARETGVADARRAFGNATLLQESSREAWGWLKAEWFLQDLRYAARTLRKNPGFTTVVVLTLALGIGANIAVFSLVDRLLLRPLPFPDAERLATIYYRSAGDSTSWSNMAYPEYLWFRERADVFSGLAAYDDVDFQLQGDEKGENVAGEIVSANYFQVLGVAPALGRSFLPEEDTVPGRDLVTVLGYGLWQRRFGGDRGIVGRKVTIDGASFTVVGIAPRGFDGLRLDRKARPELWVPVMAYPVVLPSLLPPARLYDIRNFWTNQWLSVTGRIKPGLSLAQAQSGFQPAAERLKREHWLTDFRDVGAAKWSAELVPANEARFPPDSRSAVTTFLSMLMAVVGAVLLIACANVASLLLASALKRRREIGVRLALGAGRARLFRQLVTESMLLAAMGGAAGLAVAYAVQMALTGIHQPFHMQLLMDAGLDGRVLAFATVLALATGAIFGLVPLRQAWRVELTAALRGETPGAEAGRFRARNLLIVVQVALSVVLVSGAGLFVRTLRNAQAADVTRDAGQVLLVTMGRTPRPEAFYTQVLERVRALPGVRSAALVMEVPLGGRRGGTNLSVHPGERARQVDWNVVSEEYFTTVGLPVVRGRAFNGRDRAGAPAVAIVNEVMARRFWPNEDPIGKTVRFTKPARVAEIVGVVEDGKFRNYRAEIKPCIYAPLAQESLADGMSLEVRAAVDPQSLAAAVVHAIHGVERNVPVTDVTTLEGFRNAGLGQERLSASLLGGLGLLALAISGVGIYGVLAFFVARRTREIGVRIALGASRGSVLRLVARQALILIATGACLGCAAALALARLVANLLYGIAPTDPITYLATSALLVAVGLAAAFVPAGRATRIDPARALRCE